MNEGRKMWFAPKAYGYGAGLPISWEGWALLAGFLIAVVTLHVLARTYLSGSARGFVPAVGTGILLVPFVLIIRARTEGGWRWRDGDE